VNIKLFADRFQTSG